MKKALWSLACAALMLLIAGAPASAKVKQGDKEIAFFGALISQSFDSGGSASEALIQVSGGFFISNASQVGGSLINVSSDTGGVTSTVRLINGFYKFHFNTDTDTVPYVGAQAGVAEADVGGTSESGASFGAMAGVKMFLSENLSVNPEFNILHSTLAGVGVTQTTLQIGLSYYF
jgi:Outer membrane protein beta-barrel domain